MDWPFHQKHVYLNSDLFKLWDLIEKNVKTNIFYLQTTSLAFQLVLVPPPTFGNFENFGNVENFLKILNGYANQNTEAQKLINKNMIECDVRRLSYWEQTEMHTFLSIASRQETWMPKLTASLSASTVNFIINISSHLNIKLFQTRTKISWHCHIFEISNKYNFYGFISQSTWQDWSSWYSAFRIFTFIRQDIHNKKLAAWIHVLLNCRLRCSPWTGKQNRSFQFISKY